jgi:hypothetical protein
MKIEFTTDSAAFEDDTEGEIRAIMERLVDRVTTDLCTSGTIRDSNGNTIGSWEF